jgi:hypothetical protein
MDEEREVSVTFFFLSVLSLLTSHTIMFVDQNVVLRVLLTNYS